MFWWSEADSSPNTVCARPQLQQLWPSSRSSSNTPVAHGPPSSTAGRPTLKPALLPLGSFRGSLPTWPWPPLVQAPSRPLSPWLLQPRPLLRWFSEILSPRSMHFARFWSRVLRPCVPDVGNLYVWIGRDWVHFLCTIRSNARRALFFCPLPPFASCDARYGPATRI